MKRLTDEQINAMSAEELKRFLTAQQLRIEHLLYENAQLRHALFGKKSEKLSRYDMAQALLFNEIEDSAQSEEEERQARIDAAPLFVHEHTRKRPGRRRLPANLPRREILHDLSEEEKTCPLHGASFPRIGEDVSERLHIIPMQVEVERHVRPKYGQCPICKKSHDPIDPDAPSEVKMAPIPKSLIPGSIITPALLAYIITAKFCDALPFYRLEKIFARSGVDLSRSTMSSWAITVAKKGRRLRKLMWDELRRANVIHIDETTVQVLKEPGRKPTQKSYMWAFRSRGDKPVVIFEYRVSRGGRFLRRRLRRFSGTFMADGYAGYEDFSNRDDIIRVGCWAHVRRKFFEASKFNSPHALWFLEKIKDLYLLEKKFIKHSNEKRKEERQKHSRPIVNEIYAKIHALAPTTLTESPLQKAMKYTLNQWNYLLPFLDNGEIPIDNNAMENELRPFVVGRKNWLFNDTQKGAAASAFYYSLIQTAKANGHEPYRYLRYLFEHLAETDRNTESLRELLPMHVSPDAVKRHFERSK